MRQSRCISTVHLPGQRLVGKIRFIFSNVETEIQIDPVPPPVGVFLLSIPFDIRRIDVCMYCWAVSYLLKMIVATETSCCYSQEIHAESISWVVLSYVCNDGLVVTVASSLHTQIRPSSSAFTSPQSFSYFPSWATVAWNCKLYTRFFSLIHSGFSIISREK